MNGSFPAFDKSVAGASRLNNTNGSFVFHGDYSVWDIFRAQMPLMLGLYGSAAQVCDRSAAQSRVFAVSGLAW